MKTTQNDTDAIHMPPDLLAEARRAANEEHRPADELVSDAVRRYLESRRTQGRNEHAQQATGATENKRTLIDLFKPLRGLDVEFTRNPSTGRPVDL
jgi:Arc/MetJ family transcription regulator